MDIKDILIAIILFITQLWVRYHKNNIKYPTQPEKRKKAINDAGPHADELSLLRANKMFDVEKTVNTNMR